MFKPHKHQNLIFILAGASLFIVMIATILESYGIDRTFVFFVLLALGIITAIVIGVILIFKFIKRKKKLKAWKNNNFNDYYKNLNRRK